MIVETVVGSAVGLGVMGGAFLFLLRDGSPSHAQERKELTAQLGTEDEAIRAALKDPAQFASPAEANYVDQQKDLLKVELEKERETLAKIEATLDGAQKEVEQKETEQQELKISQKQDEQKLIELKTRFDEIEEEATALEKSLADSLKDLSELINELEEGSRLRLLMEGLSKTMEESAQLLRDLYLENKSVNERVENLSQQQKDLEDEYTRLVEQQLGA